MKKMIISAMCIFSLTLAVAGENQLTIKGSDTMVHLVSVWAEKFMKANEGAELSVTGGGSGTGIAALINGTTDVCAASRTIKEKEIKLAKKRGTTPMEHVVARDGIAVVIHPSNPINELTIDQIGKIYTGEITNWNQVGGEDHKILVLSRESSSGTYVFFQEHVLKKHDYTPKARLMPATSSIVQSVSTDKFAIGYVGLGYAEKAADKIKAINVKNDAKSPAVKPSEKTVVDGSYSIARPLHLYTKGEPEGITKKFLDYAFSKEGQNIVVETGYVAVK
ncbi:MAG: phosphate ABC transporter substrate-binding protein [Fibrobacteria bacterium]|nr:phosphate ABC transporter substrate-binding protein [Fibrobacteria bacterium]